MCFESRALDRRFFVVNSNLLENVRELLLKKAKRLLQRLASQSEMGIDVIRVQKI